MAKPAPTYVEPSKGGAVLNNKAEGAHVLVEKGDPKVNGPYLDDVRELEEKVYRTNRKKNLSRKAKNALSSVHRSEVPGGERVKKRNPKGTKTHPVQRPMSNPSDLVNPEANSPVPTLDDARKDFGVAATKSPKKAVAKKTAAKPKKKASPRKAVAAKKAPSKKAK